MLQCRVVVVGVGDVVVVHVFDNGVDNWSFVGVVVVGDVVDVDGVAVGGGVVVGVVDRVIRGCVGACVGSGVGVVVVVIGGKGCAGVVGCGDDVGVVDGGVASCGVGGMMVMLLLFVVVSVTIRVVVAMVVVSQVVLWLLSWCCRSCVCNRC